MSDPQENRPGRNRLRDNDEQLHAPGSPSSAQLASSDLSDESTAAPSASTRPAAADQPADEWPLPFTPPKESRRLPLLSGPLDVLATVELQLALQFLDTKSKLIAARCSRSLRQAADHPFAWRGPSVLVSSRHQPRLGSLIRQSLLRHAPIALKLKSDLPAAEVAAIPRLRELTIDYGISADRILQESALPALRGLQTLRVFTSLPGSALRLLPSLPALHTLELWGMDEPADWSWLPAMPALTDLEVTGMVFQCSPQSAADTIGRCAQLRSLRLRYPRFDVDAFVRLRSAPALRHLDLQHLWDIEAHHSAFSNFAQLESLRLQAMERVDLLLPQLAHAPALRALIIACRPAVLRVGGGPTIPSRDVLRRLLAAAPLLAVRLEVAASIDQWRSSSMHLRGSAPDRQQIDEQWRELQRMGAELERVTIADQ